LRVAIVVAAKELRQRLRDRSAIFIAFVAPTLLAAIVTGAFGSGFGSDNTDLKMRVAVADQDHSQISKAFTGVLRSRQLRNLITTLAVASPEAARDMVDRERTAAAYVIPKGFQDRVTSGAKTEITVLGRVDDQIFRDIAQAIATGFTKQLNASRLSIFTTIRARGGDVSVAPSLVAAAARERMPVQVREIGVAKRDVSGANYFGPGMAMFFLFFTVGAGARSLFAEREQGTLPRILAAPAPKSSLLVGKAGATFVLGLVSMTSVYLTMRLLFGVHWGDPIAIVLLTLLIVLALMAVTAVVQTFAKTEAQAGAYSSMVGMAFALAGGNFFPLFAMPAFIQKLSALTPNGWALRGFTDIAYDGAKAINLLPNFAAIGAFVVVCGSVALLKMQRLRFR
jgi:ABC-2 type transport system permease protein